MDLNIKETKFGDIVLWDKNNEKFIVVKNYYKLPNVLKTSGYEVCCMSLGNGSFVSLKESIFKYTWFEAMKRANVYNGIAPIKLYIPSIDELRAFYPFIEEFNCKIKKLKSLGIACDEIKMAFYWSSMEYSSTLARGLFTYGGGVIGIGKNYSNYVRAFVAFKTF